MNKFMIIFLITAWGCMGPSAKHQSPVSGNGRLSMAAFHGHWIIRPYFDSLENDHFRGTLNASEYGITEIAIDSADRDSLWLLNEDLERTKIPYHRVDSVSLQLRMTRKINSMIRIRPETKSMTLQLDDSSRIYDFFPVPDSMVSKDQEISSFRKMLNCRLSRFHLTAYDPMLDAPHGVRCHFDCNGNVSGIHKFKTYYIFVNGDMANCEGLDRIEFSDGNKASAFGMQFTGRAINLYYLKKTTTPGERPRYRKGDFFMELSIADK